MSVTWTEDGASATAEINGDAFSGGTATTKVWTVESGNGSWRRSGGIVQRHSVGGYLSAYPSTATGATSGVFSEATKVTGSSNSSPAVLNSSNVAQGYITQNRRLYRDDSTIIGSSGSAPGDGSVMKLSRSGNDVVLLDDTAAYISVTDATYGTNIPGIRGTDLSSADLDDITLQGDELVITTAGQLVDRVRLTTLVGGILA